MGIYLNPTAQLFKIALASRIYVDKSKLIEITNEKFGTDERFICVSRPRRFGKTMDLSMLEAYYSENADGKSIYNPRSVTAAVRNRECGNYWTKTETYEALRKYIQMDINGLKKSIIKMIAGEEIAINHTQFQNDMVTFHDADDVLTLLVHL